MATLPKQELLEIGFKEREIAKVQSFVSAVFPYLGNLDEVIDLCSGNGLTSFIFLLNGFASKSAMYDIKRTKKFDKLKELFHRHGLPYEFNQQDITLPLNLNGDDKKRAIISLHPCSELSDRVIQLGIDHQIHFALMTCCHKQVEQAVKYKLQSPPDTRLMLYDEPQDYFDLVRQRYIEEQGWTCHRAEIDRRISPRNHVLIGIN